MMAAPSPRFEYREPEEWIPGRWFDAPPVWWRQKRMPHRENLMRLPEDANVLLHGRELAKDQFLIDRDGNVYRYLQTCRRPLCWSWPRHRMRRACHIPFEPQTRARAGSCLWRKPLSDCRRWRSCSIKPEPFQRCLRRLRLFAVIMRPLPYPLGKNSPIGVWGERHLHYLKEYRRGTYINSVTPVYVKVERIGNRA